MSSMLRLTCRDCNDQIRVHKDSLDKLPNPWVCVSCTRKAQEREYDAIADFFIARERKRLLKADAALTDADVSRESLFGGGE